MGARTVHRVICGVLAAVTTGLAWAHGTSGAGGSEGVFTAGAGAGWIVVALAAAAALYVVGVARLWQASAPGRGLRIREGLLFVAGLALLAIALLGPFESFAARSFAAHMVQHELLMLAAAPLLVMGRPLAVWAWALSVGQHRATRAIVRNAAWRRFWQFATRPFGATLLQLTALLVWHVPSAFDGAAMHAGVHALQHATFLATALCFWWALQTSARRVDRDARPAAIGVMALFCTMIVTGAFGALLTFAPVPLYRTFAGLPVPWAGSALEDQQLGGLFMWVPGGTIYLLAALVLARRLLLRGIARPSPSRPAVSFGLP